MLSRGPWERGRRPSNPERLTSQVPTAASSADPTARMVYCHDDAPVAGICEKTSVPARALWHPSVQNVVHDQAAASISEPVMAG